MKTNVLNLPGNYKIIANNSDGIVTIAANSVLGTGTYTNTIKILSTLTGDLIPTDVATFNIGTTGTYWNIIHTDQEVLYSENNVGNRYNRAYDPADIYDTKEHRKTGSLYVTGGVGIEKDLNVGGFIYGRIETANTALSVLITATNIDFDFYPTFVPDDLSYQVMFVDKDGVGDGLRYNPLEGKLKTDRVLIEEIDQSVSTSTGALVVKGGVGIAATMTIGGDILTDVGLTSRIGTSSTQWAEAYVHDVYTKILASTTGTLEIKPEGGLTDVFGDIRVRGANPIGTAPVVTNVLYVTVDGNDTNDGRAMDPSRACRTVGAAMNSPYYQPGTQILVSPGHYLEDNPLRMKPYTSVRGSDIRTTFIEPINKTQDLFHVDSGCYLNYMTFINGRSGLLEGVYDKDHNRGAYATAFPPLTGEDRIDLFHSPYIQNCTNQSGPWLKDGTMFVPNQTVQIPRAVGTGTWIANTTSIIVSVSTGTLEQGMAINAGQQNPGFFNARTLLLANKPFLQEQVVKYINQQISTNAGIWTNFTYNQEKCRRDVGILVENVTYDAAFGGNEKSVDSGLSYYNGVVSLIAGQEQQTTAAINYLNDRCLEVINNTTCTNTLAGGLYTQVRNTVLVNGSVSGDSITNLFNIITTIINNGPESAPAIYKSTGPDAAYVSAEILMQANRKFIQEDTINYINNIIYADSFPYSEIKCRRDTGLIIDSIAIDLLYGSTTQSNFAGIQYWNKSGYTGDIANEITTTTSAIRYLKELAVKIIQNITYEDDLVVRFSSKPTWLASHTQPTQDVGLEAATSAEVVIIKPLFDTMIDIISGINTTWTDSIIPNGNPSNLVSIQNAVALLQANKVYMAKEVNAYVQESTVNGGLGFSTSSYNVTKCERDVGYIIDCLSFDLLNGGNRQSIQAAVYYFSFSGTSNIQNQEIQTTDAFTHLSTIAQSIIQAIPIATSQLRIKQNLNIDPATATEAGIIDSKVSIINDIISNVALADEPAPISYLTRSTDEDVIKAYEALLANKEFIIEEVIAYIDQSYNPGKFNYNEALCYRDTGLIVDAISQDILLGGNQKSVEAGLAYWNFGYNQVTGQETTTTMAINHARDIALQIIANTPVVPSTGTTTQQVINTFFQYGGDYMPQEAVTRNFGIVTNIIEQGPIYAPPIYAGGGLFALTGLNGSDVKIAPTVSSIVEISSGIYRVGLSSPTIGFGTNSTLYFGDTLIYPKQNNEVEALSLEYTGNSSTWNQRKVDPIGSMGGSLVDGAVISARSPIQSFVYDAFTQLTQGGRGVRVTNDGYAQLVSVFTIFSSVGVQTDNGGIASIVNSNANFGDICLLSTGFGSRKFSGTIYNPINKAYPDDPEFNQYYPTGYWPNNGRVRVFLPDVDDRPHISLVMEVIPPTLYRNYEGNLVNFTNDQGFPGFLNAAPNTGTLTTSSITITGIDTTGIAIGNSLYVRDQSGSQYGSDGNLYVQPGTFVTDLGYQSVTLNYALTSGGSDSGNNPALGSYNNNYFDLYFCGNAYYTVLSSEVGTNPKTDGINLLSAEATGGEDQIDEHIDILEDLNRMVNRVINNQTVTATNSVGFVYDRNKCSRDIGLIVDALAQDLLFDGTSQSDFSGIQYWNHGTSRVGLIDTELTTTTNTINYVKSLAQKIVLGDTSGTRYTGIQPVTSNTATSNESNIVVADFEIITGILSGSIPLSGTNGVTNIIVPNRLTASENTNIENAYNLLQANIEYLKDEAIAYVEATKTVGFNYDPTTCRRDVGYMVDSVSFDLLYGGNRQAIQSGVYYWGYNASSTALPGEVTQSVAAYDYMKSILTNIITGDPLTVTYQTSVPQNTSGSYGTSAEVSIVEGLVDRITNIIDGTTPISSVNKTPIDLTMSSDANVINAAAMLELNRNFLKAEVTAFVDATYPSSGEAAQVKLPLVLGGGEATSFIDLRFSEILNIIKPSRVGKPNTSAGAESVIGPSLRTKSGPEVQGGGSAITLIKENIEFLADETNARVKTRNGFNFIYDELKCKRDVRIILQRLIYDIESGGRYNSVMTGLSYWSRYGTHHIVQLGENVTRTDLFPDGVTVNFYQRSYISASGYVFEYVGAGTNYGALPQRGIADPVQGKEVVQLDSGKVFFTSTDQNGDFRIGPGLVISQATGVLSGRTFTKSLFANMTPFILAIEGGGMG